MLLNDPNATLMLLNRKQESPNPSNVAAIAAKSLPDGVVPLPAEEVAAKESRPQSMDDLPSDWTRLAFH